MMDYFHLNMGLMLRVKIIADMGRGRSCTPELREIIIRKHIQEKKTVRQIAAELGCSKTKVHNALLHFGRIGTTQNALRKRRARKTTAKDDRRIVRAIKKNPFLTAKKIRDGLLMQMDSQVSDRTIRRRLCEAGLNGRIARKKPHVSKKNLRSRLEFAREHVSKPLEFWKKILWSDESKFNLFGSDGKKYVRRPMNKPYDPRYTLKTIKHGGGNIMVWGAFSWHGVGPIHRITQRMDQYVYKDIMENTMEPYADEVMPVTFIFQQDNDPKHTAKSVKAWFYEKKLMF